VSDPLASKRAKLIDLIMLRRRSDSRGRGVEGVESDRDAIEADIVRLSDSMVDELITRFERLPGAVVWLFVP
jgi:hypothetical protein